MLKRIFGNSTCQPFLTKKKGQVWIETMIYTLIALALIGTVLAFAKPKIEQLQDKVVIEQSMKIMEDINSEIQSVITSGTGNRRIIEISLKKGEMIIYPEENKIQFQIESKLQYSEPGTEIPVGSVNVLTEKIGKLNRIYITSNLSRYTGYDFKYSQEENPKTISKSSSLQKLSISNEGKNVNTNLVEVNFEVIG